MIITEIDIIKMIISNKKTEGNIMKKTLIVVDMQKDFIDGALGSKEAVAIVENVKKKIAEYQANGDDHSQASSHRSQDLQVLYAEA